MINNNNLYDYHIIRRLQMQFSSSGKKRLIVSGEVETEIAMSWASVAKKTRALSNALLDMGVAVQENVGIFSQNSIDWSIADIATFAVACCHSSSLCNK